MFRDLIPKYIEQPTKAFKYKFTVFTPVYNCEKTIERVHDCLVKQSFKDFEWLIINDGSTDSSHNTISSIIKKSSLEIKYIHNTKNKHKMSCFMQAIKLADGDFFLTFDADDECVDNALEVFNSTYNSIPVEKKNTIVAITALCIDQNGDQVGDSYPTSPYFSNTFESYTVKRILGEKWGFTKTNILRNIVYNKAFISNGFMPEGLVWNLLAKKDFITVYINKALRIYHTNIENSISNSNIEKTALGSATQLIANYNWFFKENFFKAPTYFIKSLYFLLRLSNYLDFNLKNYTTSIDSPIIKFFFVLLWPIRRFLK